MNGAWWGVVVGLLLVSALTRNSLLLLIGLLMALLVGASQLWGRYSLVGVDYRRRFGATRLFCGEETDLTVELRNAKPLPLPWLRVDDEYASALVIADQPTESIVPGQRRLVNLFTLRWYQRVVRRYRVRGTRRGVWSFGPVQLRATDLFGFHLKRERRSQVDRILVYPHLFALTALGLPARYPFGERSTPRQLWEDPLRLMGVRDYAPGDNYRHIHWKASARRQQLQTKRFEPSASQPLAIFLNLNTAAVRVQERDWPLQEFAISVAASVARWAWEEGYSLGLYANALMQGRGQRVSLPPRTHPEQLLRALEALAEVENLGRWPIGQVLETEAARLRLGTTLVVISALLSDDLRRGLADLRRREFGVSLITLGAQRPTGLFPGLRAYHLDVAEGWRELAALELA